MVRPTLGSRTAEEQNQNRASASVVVARAICMSHVLLERHCGQWAVNATRQWSLAAADSV